MGEAFLFGHSPSPSLARKHNALAQQRLCRGHAQRYNELGAHGGDFSIEPPAALLDFACVRPLMETALAARLVLEMLHDVGQISFRTINTSKRKALIEEVSRRPHEWTAT